MPGAARGAHALPLVDWQEKHSRISTPGSGTCKSTNRELRGTRHPNSAREQKVLVRSRGSSMSSLPIISSSCRQLLRGCYASVAGQQPDLKPTAKQALSRPSQSRPSAIRKALGKATSRNHNTRLWSRQHSRADNQRHSYYYLKMQIQLAKRSGKNEGHVGARKPAEASKQRGNQVSCSCPELDRCVPRGLWAWLS